MIKKYFNRHPLFYLFLVLFVLSFFHNSKFLQPEILPDEIIQLSHALYMATTKHFMFIGYAFSNFGYSLIISPLFLLSLDSFATYKLILAINGIIASANIFLFYYILKEIFSFRKEKAVWIAFVLSLYPSIFLHSSNATSESLFIFAFSLSMILFWWVLKDGSYLSFILFGLVFSFLYTIHLRAFMLIFLVPLFIVSLALLKKLEWKKVLIFLLVNFYVYYLTKSYAGHLMSIAWQDTIAYDPKATLIEMANLHYVRDWLIIVLGQFFYLVLATFGIFLIGFSYLLNYLYEKFKKGIKKAFKDDKSVWTMYLFFIAGILFVTSSLLFVGGVRSDSIFYGRHNEPFLLIFFMAGLYRIYKKGFSRAQYLAISGFILFSGLLLTWTKGAFINGNFLVFSVPSLTPWRVFFTDFGYYKIIAIALLFLLLTFILFRTFGKRFKYGMVLLAVFYIGMIIINRNYISIYRSININYYSNMAYYLEERNIKEISYDMDNYLCSKSGEPLAQLHLHMRPRNFDRWQFMLLDTKVDGFRSAKKEKPTHKYVVASECWPQAEELHAKRLFWDGANHLILWEIDPN